MRERIAMLSAVLLLAGAPVFAWGVDTDNDGIRDGKDKCPTTPVGAKVDKAGCESDADGDGIPNGVDRCSKTPPSWPIDQYGCPRDTDLDGVVDGLDTCTGTLSGAKVDTKGCPWDADGDMVLEGLDRCPGTPQGYRVEEHGCPTDMDHDGVNDAYDKCQDSLPREAVDADGCRVKAPSLFPEGTDKVRLEGVTFEKNAIELPPESAQVVAFAAASLKDWPETRVEVAVHTDRAGSAAANRELSQRRADYVKSYLVAQGIDESRITAKGYGESGQSTERSVELKRIGTN
ncbi:MAG TPA: OmpA family protein [Candidatus Polarisedimenticolia bacterium]|nr:OmpA family protein [Candidatus Polarisedimenticolia bacterium]